MFRVLPRKALGSPTREIMRPLIWEKSGRWKTKGRDAHELSPFILGRTDEHIPAINLFSCESFNDASMRVLIFFFGLCFLLCRERPHHWKMFMFINKYYCFTSVYLWLGTLVIKGPVTVSCDSWWPISFKLSLDDSQDMLAELQVAVRFSYSGVSVHRLLLLLLDGWRRRSRQQVKMASILQSLPVRCWDFGWLCSWWYWWCFWLWRGRTLIAELLLLLDWPSPLQQQLLLSPLSQDDEVDWRSFNFW